MAASRLSCFQGLAPHAVPNCSCVQHLQQHALFACTHTHKDHAHRTQHKNRTNLIILRPNPTNRTYLQVVVDLRAGQDGRFSNKKLEDDWPESIFPQVLIQPRRHLYIAAASVSARGDAQCVWSHESSISSSYERKHGSARSHIFTSVKTRRVKLVKLETNYKQKEEQSIAKLTRRPQFLQSTLAQLSSVQDGSAQLGSVKVGSTQATFREWLCATGSVQVGSARVCSAQCALHELRRAISHESGLRKLHRSRLLRASSSLQAAARKRSMQVALRKCSEQVALRQLLRASALRMCSVQVGLCKLLSASALRKFSVQVALRKLLCASCSEQVLPELWECTSRTIFCT